MKLGMPGMVLRSAAKKPATRLFPAEIRPAYAATRGHVAMDIAKCNFCTLCQLRCPTGAIVVNKQEKTWQIDRMRCILCTACVGACTRKCPTMETSYAPPVGERRESLVRFTQVTIPGTSPAGEAGRA